MMMNSEEAKRAHQSDSVAEGLDRVATEISRQTDELQGTLMTIEERMGGGGNVTAFLAGAVVGVAAVVVAGVV